MRTSRLSAILPLVASAWAATVTYNWDVTWVTAAPDGFSRPVIGVNGQWPCPKIEANVGDTVVVTINNKLGNETTGIHFHGINQINTNDMDGPSGVTQCPVPPGSSVTYSFTADEPGTYWYHSHNMGQYPDGFRGPLIVHDTADPYAGKYDEEIILTVSDWYHSQTVDLVRNMLVTSNTNFIPPFPDGILVNEGGPTAVNFTKGKTYRLRIISFAAFASAMVHFNSHTMQVIMNDGSYIKQSQAYQLRIAPAQRYDVLISAIDRDHGNYPYLFSLDINRDYNNPNSVPPVAWPHNFTGYLVMDPTKALTNLDVVTSWKPQDDAHFEPLDGLAPYGPVTTTAVLNFTFCFDANNIPRACFNGQPNIPQKVPALYTAATTGDQNTNPAIYGKINPIIVKYGEIVQIVINNQDAAIHPFHLHGHQFQVLARPKSNTGNWPGRDVNYPADPPRRDVVSVNANSYAVLRFKADNPGVYLFHCHIEWHVEMGLTATVIEAPEKLAGLTFPDDHINNCKILGIPYSGNAAGHANVSDTSGFVDVPPTTYDGALYTPPASKSRFRLARHSL